MWLSIRLTPAPTLRLAKPGANTLASYLFSITARATRWGSAAATGSCRCTWETGFLVRCMHVRPAVHPLGMRCGGVQEVAGMRCGGVQEVAARRSRASEGPLRPRFRVQPEAACNCSESVQRGALDGCRFYVTVHPRRRWGCERRHSRRNTRWYYTRAVTTQVDVSRRYGGYRHTQDMTYTPVPSLSELAQKALQLAYVLRGEALRRSHVWRWHSPNPQ